jgi:polysaccharide export outer membrane protein
MTIKRLLAILVVLALAGPALTVHAQSTQKPAPAPGTGKQAPKPPAAPAPAPVAQAPAVPPPPGYVIGPDDVLQVLFRYDKDLTTEVVVRPDGMISLPILSDVQAAGLTPEQLRDKVTASAKRFIEDPAVTIIVKQINSRRVFITGQVARPGPYALTSPTTVMQLIAMAGGRNVATGPIMTPAEIAEANPDIIIVPLTDWTMATFDSLRSGNEPWMKNLTAVKESRIRTVSYDVVGRPGPRIAEAVAGMAHAIHPELYTNYTG